MLKATDTQARYIGSWKKSANFVSSHMAKSYEHIVWLLRTLSANVDNKKSDKPTTLKKAMSRYN